KGITILGKSVNPSVSGAEMQFVRFSEEYYGKNDIHKFAEERRSKMESKTIKVDKTELKETPWGSVNKVELRNKVMNAKNRDSLVHDVYALVEDGWQESPSSKLKYPIMQIDGDIAYYNRFGLASALGYAKKENETAVVEKVEKLYKKFKIDEGEKKMSKTKFSQLEGREVYGAVIEKVHKKLGNHFYVEEIYNDHIEVRDERTKEMYKIKADIKLGKDDEAMNISIDFDTMKKSSEQKQFAEDDDKEKMECNKMDDDEDGDNGEDDEDDDKNGEDEEQEKMSADANTDALAQAKLLEDQAEQNKKTIAEKDDIIMKQDARIKKLEAFKFSVEDAQRKNDVEKTMSEVKSSFIDKVKFEELKEEGLACKFEDMTSWKNKVKALAFEQSKGKKPTRTETFMEIPTLWGIQKEDRKSSSLWG
ncbi:MAG: hypothetical protein ACRCS6_13435, partial [Turicibacter sp.]